MVIPPVYVAIAGALPALLAMWYFDRLDRKRPEPAGLRRWVALFVILVHVPRVAAAPDDQLQWIMLGVALSLSGSAWLVRKHATSR